MRNADALQSTTWQKGVHKEFWSKGPRKAIQSMTLEKAPADPTKAVLRETGASCRVCSGPDHIDPAEIQPMAIPKLQLEAECELTPGS